MLSIQHVGGLKLRLADFDRPGVYYNIDESGGVRIDLSDSGKGYSPSSMSGEYSQGFATIITQGKARLVGLYSLAAGAQGVYSLINEALGFNKSALLFFDGASIDLLQPDVSVRLRRYWPNKEFSVDVHGEVVFKCRFQNFFLDSLIYGDEWRRENFFDWAYRTIRQGAR